MNSHSSRALIVDDDVAVYTLCQSTLQPSGFVVETCSTGQQALHLLETTSYDLLLIDLHMPDMHGIDVLRETLRRTSRAAIVVMSGDTTVEDPAQAMLLGAHGILLKPFSTSELRTVVAEVLRKRAADQQSTQFAIFRPLVDVSESLLGELDLARLCDRIATVAQQELRAARATLVLDQPGRGPAVAAVAGTPPSARERLERAVEELARWLISEQQPLRIDPDRQAPLAIQSLLDAYYAGRSVLGIPLQIQGRAVGALIIEHLDGRESFAATDQHLISLLARQMAIALENARLYALAEQRAASAARLNRLSTALAATLDLDEVLRLTGQCLLEALPITGGLVLLSDDTPQRFSQQYAFGRVTLAPLLIDGHVPEGLAAQVVADGRPRYVHPRDRSQLTFDERQIAEVGQGLLCVPLKTEQGIGGVIEVVSRPDSPLSEAETELLITLTGPVAQAIERARTHALIARSEARYRALFEHAHDAVILLDDRATRVLEVNPAVSAITGYSRNELLALDAARLIIPSSPSRGQSLLELVRLGEFQATAQHRDGRSIPVAVGLSEVSYDNEHYLLLIARDIGEEQRMAQRLVQSEKLAGMGRLATCMAHEINNPLQALQSSLHLLINRSPPLTEEKREIYLRKAGDEVERLTTIVRRMLEFFRPSREGMRPISLHEILEDTISQVTPSLQQNNIRIERDWFSHLPRVRGISHHLREVFLSLVQNAIDAMPHGGTLTLRTSVQEERLRRVSVVEFIDTGNGIPEEEQHLIFEPFYSTKKDGSGLGLGLAISYSIVEQHDGLITVTSSERGSTFRVALPAL
ncbi:MAG TPA: response regulator [Roseiflexaceae bacterium]|nr:response regulator [Roseiflexaceae bacterium]